MGEPLDFWAKNAEIHRDSHIFTLSHGGQSECLIFELKIKVCDLGNKK